MWRNFFTYLLTFCDNLISWPRKWQQRHNTSKSKNYNLPNKERIKCLTWMTWKTFNVGIMAFRCPLSEIKGLHGSLGFGFVSDGCFHEDRSILMMDTWEAIISLSPWSLMKEINIQSIFSSLFLLSFQFKSLFTKIDFYTWSGYATELLFQLLQITAVYHFVIHKQQPFRTELDHGLTLIKQ